VTLMKASPMVSHTAVTACQLRIRVRPGRLDSAGSSSADHRPRGRRRPIHSASPPITSTGSQLAAISE
jgi:hypothetical protein